MHVIEPYIFVPLDGCDGARLEFVCSEHDWHWTVEGSMRLDGLWSDLLSDMREHVERHRTQ